MLEVADKLAPLLLWSEPSRRMQAKRVQLARVLMPTSGLARLSHCISAV